MARSENARRSPHLNCKFRTCFSQHPIRGASERGVPLPTRVTLTAYVQNKLALLSQLGRTRSGPKYGCRTKRTNERERRRGRKFYGGRFEISSLTDADDGWTARLTPRRSPVPFLVSRKVISVFLNLRIDRLFFFLSPFPVFLSRNLTLRKLGSVCRQFLFCVSTVSNAAAVQC